VSGGVLRELRGQERAGALLDGAFLSGRVPHAYLFAGPSGVGKLSAALAAAASWMCERGGIWCGECRHCRRVMSLQHPDVRLTIPSLGTTQPEDIAALFTARAADGTTPFRLPGNCTVPIDAVREIQGRLALAPFEGRGRVEILVDADKMRQEAANALLKTLEEPPPATLLVLTAVRASAILPTVRSRVQTVRFARLDADAVADVLRERTGMDPAKAAEMAAASDGSVGNALESSAAGDDSRDDALSALGLMYEGDDSAAVEFAAGAAKKYGTASSASLCARIRSFLHDSRRALEGLPPLFSLPGEVLCGGGREAAALDEATRLFAVCETRLRAGVLPQAALTAAMTGAAALLGRKETK